MDLQYVPQCGTPRSGRVLSQRARVRAAQAAWHGSRRTSGFARALLQDPRASFRLPMPPNAAPDYARSFNPATARAGGATFPGPGVHRERELARIVERIRFASFIELEHENVTITRVVLTEDPTRSPTLQDSPCQSVSHLFPAERTGTRHGE